MSKNNPGSDYRKPVIGLENSAAKTGRYKDLPLRVVSAAALAVFAVLCAWLGGAVFLLFAALIAALIYYEFVGIVRSVLPARIAVAGALLLALLIASFLVNRPEVGIALVISGAFVLAVWEVAISRSVWGAGALVYAGGPFIAMNAARAGDGGFFLILFVFACVWGADSFAYFAGKSFGGPKLAPVISPNKTWSGFLGGFAGAILTSIAVTSVFGYRVGMWSVLLAVILAFGSQLGDLFESWIKRRFGVKDSSNLIPGHGGLLDRIDGFIFAIVLAFIIGLMLPNSESLMLGDAFLQGFF